MNAIGRLLRVTPREDQPTEFNRDVIFPTSLLDDTKVFRQLMLAWTFCFNDVLDPEMLHSSLLRLLEIGDWRKLGGRLKLNKGGRLEIHVPQAFTAQRPAVTFTHESFDVNICDHPLAKNIPKPTENPSMQPGGSDFIQFAASSDTPVTAYDLMNKDIPQISLRITSFTDATLVALVWPHTLMDALGIQALLEAWSLVLEGREAAVPPILGAREDCVISAAKPQSANEPTEAEEELNIAPKRVKGMGLFLFSLRFLWGLLWNGACESRSVFLPKEVVARLRRHAMKEAEATAGPKDTKPFISEGDVLAAWATKIIASSEPRQRPVTIFGALNLRYWMKSLISTTGVYAQNLTVGTMTFLSPAMTTASVGHIAAAHRQHLVEQTTQPQLRALLRTIIAENQKGDATFLFGESNMLLIVVTNWTKAKILTAANFRAAVLRPGHKTTARANPPGTMTSFLSSTMKPSMLTSNIVRVIGKDHEGNYWLGGILLPRAWAKMEEELALL